MIKYLSNISQDFCINLNNNVEFAHDFFELYKGQCQT